MTQKPASEDISVNIRDLACFVLLKWRLILIAGILFAGCYAVWQTKGSSGNSDAEHSDYIQEENARYRSNMEALEQSVSGLRSLLAERNAYFSDSVLMRIDPGAKAVTRGTVKLVPDESVPYEELEEKRSLYLSEMTGTEFLSDIAADEGTEPKYLIELIRTGKRYSSVITLETWGITEEDSERLYRRITEKLSSAQRESGCTFEISDPISATEIDDELYLQKAEKYAQVTLMNKDLQSALDQSRTVEKPESAGSGKSLSLKKTAAAGAAGVLAAAVLMTVLFLISPSVKGKEEIRQMYGLRFLGSCAGHSGSGLFSFIDRAISKGIRGERTVSLKESETRIAEQIRHYGQGRRILVTGSCSPDRIRKFAGDMETILKEEETDVILICEPGITENAAAAKAADASDMILFAEEAGRSAVSSVREEIICAREMGCEILGYVMI